MPFVVIAISQTLRILELGIFSEEEIESGLKHKVSFIDNDIEINNI